MVFPLPVPGPGSEVTELAIIPIIRQPQLRPDEEDFLVVDDDSAVVVDVLVDDRPTVRSERDVTSSEMNARTSRCHRRRLQSLQRPGSSRGPPMNATPCHLIDNDVITYARPNDKRSNLPRSDLDIRIHCDPRYSDKP